MEINVEKADSLKAEANEYFKKQDYLKAIPLYSAAIEHNPNSAVLFANRSFAYIKTECFVYA